MTEPKPPAFLKVPSIHEVLTLSVAVVALVVSVLSYRNSVSTEEALQENLTVDCEQVGGVTFSDTSTPGSADKTYEANLSFVMTAYNVSRSPVEIVSTSYARLIPGGTETSSIVGDKSTYGARYRAGPEDVRLEPATSTTFGFQQSVPISARAAQVDGVLRATSVEDADELLAKEGIDVFGKSGKGAGAAAGTDAAPPSDQDPKIIVEARTSRGKSFSGRCPIDRGPFHVTSTVFP